MHDYERMYDIHLGATTHRTVDMQATTYITTGDGGSDEGTGGAPFFPPHSSAFRSNAAGYSVMDVANATHLRWRQVQTDPARMSDYGKVIDDVWLVQHRHGPFVNGSEQGGTSGRFPSVTHDVRSGQFWDAAGAEAAPLWVQSPPAPGGGHDDW